jgi:hypothetical protein
VHEPVFVLFSGANDRALLSVLRTLSDCDSLFLLIARSAQDNIFLTDYRKSVFAIRQKDSLDLDEILALLTRIRVSEGSRRIILLATAESLARFFLANRTSIEALGITLPLPDESCYISLSDKHRFLALAERYGLRHPPSCEPNPDSIPFVAKPISDFGPLGQRYYPHLILNQADFDRFDTLKSDGTWFYQQYVRGHSFYFMYFQSKAGEVVALYQQNLLQQPDGKSMLAARRIDCPEFEIDCTFRQILKDLGYFGFVMFECIQDENAWHLIECNPRIWGPFQMAVTSGFDPRWLAGNPRVIQPGPASGYYLWLSGLIATLCHNGRPRFHRGWLGLVLRPWAYLATDVYLRRDAWRIFLKEVTGHGAP